MIAKPLKVAVVAPVLAAAVAFAYTCKFTFIGAAIVGAGTIYVAGLVRRPLNPPSEA